MGSQLKLPLTASSRSAPDKLIQKSLVFVFTLGCCYKAGMTIDIMATLFSNLFCSVNLSRAFATPFSSAATLALLIYTRSHGKWLCHSWQARNSTGWIDPSNRAISSQSHFKVSSSGDRPNSSTGKKTISAFHFVIFLQIGSDPYNDMIQVIFTAQSKAIAH